MCLQVDETDYEANINGGKVQIGSCNGNDNQKWDIIADNCMCCDPIYALRNANGKCLEVQDDKTVIVTDCVHCYDNQYFYGDQ